MSTYYVSAKGCECGCGSKEKPFKRIQQAADIAFPGDKIVVGAGEYREWVNPKRGGRSDSERIIYEAAPGERPVIKGSEAVTGWKNMQGDVWTVSVPNSLFGDYNPFAEKLGGDWLIHPTEYSVHAGDVYMDGRSFYEAANEAEVFAPTPRTEGVGPYWGQCMEVIPDDPEWTLHRWFAKVGDEETEIIANFCGEDPNAHLTEINVRMCCFFPEKTMLDYITVRGFEIAQAACPWAPPTAHQYGMLGVHWSKGWVIENNILHDAKCSAISLGKEAYTGHNLCSNEHRKPGYQYQMEAVFKALQIGWRKEKIGSHIVRNNEIYSCGQNGIVGHMGAAFSVIEHNHIHHIGAKHEFFGYEIGGIKLHAAVDTLIKGNCIHHCALGSWFDWQAQGTRITENVYFANSRDLMIEVTHGPCIVDNNILGSEYSLDNCAQGTAYVHNLICGVTRRITVLDRATPYHFAHTTQVAGAAIVYSGDDRFYQNVFVGLDSFTAEDGYCGTASYNGSPASLAEYKERIVAGGIGDHDIFNATLQPVYCGGNVYCYKSYAFDKEEAPVFVDEKPAISFDVCEKGAVMHINAPEKLFSGKTKLIDSELLGSTRITECAFETAEGKSIVFDTDLTGAARKASPTPGPIEGIKPGENTVEVWSK